MKLNNKEQLISFYDKKCKEESISRVLLFYKMNKNTIIKCDIFYVSSKFLLSKTILWQQLNLANSLIH